MKLTILAEGDEVIGVVAHREEPPKDPSTDLQGFRLMPLENQTVFITDPPSELVGRDPDADYLEVLRKSYVVTNGALRKR